MSAIFGDISSLDLLNYDEDIWNPSGILPITITISDVLASESSLIDTIIGRKTLLALLTDAHTLTEQLQRLKALSHTDITDSYQTLNDNIVALKSKFYTIDDTLEPNLLDVINTLQTLKYNTLLDDLAVNYVDALTNILVAKLLYTFGDIESTNLTSNVNVALSLKYYFGETDSTNIISTINAIKVLNAICDDDVALEMLVSVLKLGILKFSSLIDVLAYSDVVKKVQMPFLAIKVKTAVNTSDILTINATSNTLIYTRLRTLVKEE
jgi:hypothetical protein